MDTDRPYVAENAAERARLRALASRLSEDDLSHPLYDGWTVAVALAHLAFWDHRALIFLQRWQRDRGRPAPVDADTVNEAMLPLLRALPPRVAAQLAVDAAEATDRALEELDPGLAAELEAAGWGRALRRAIHRREHLDDVERALGRGGGEEN